ncbi:amino acid adenylation domain-containing protein [Streptosporangium canum]|uniref:non-ribosomal peptide synthetase n=1 Tax=Streptosporangium canum TaxID=324952 RepID=UPI0033BF62A6
MSVTSEIDSPPVPASLAQQGIWFNERLGGVGTVYTMPFSVTFDGPLDVPALTAACRALIDRHPILASTVRERQGVPYVVPAATPPVPVVADVTAARRDDLMRAEILRPFDLAAGPLVRMTLYVEAAGRATLLVVAHHLVFDGESTSVFLRDLAELYRAEVTGVPADLPVLDHDGLAGRAAARVEAGLSFAREFWSSRWRPPAEVILPGVAGAVPAVDEGAAVEFALPQESREALARLSEEIGAGRFEIVLASLHVLLHRYGNAEPTVAADLGTRSPETRDHLGAFVNELPVTAGLRPEWGFRRFVADQRFGYGLRSDLRGLFRVREVPLSRAVSGVKPGVALAPISLGYRRREAAPAFHGVDAHVEWALFNHTVRGAMRVHIVDGPGRFGVILQYNPRIMAREDAERVAAHWRALLAAVAADPDMPLAELPMLDAEETGRLLSRWNDTAAGRPPLTLPELVAAQAGRTPDATAAVCGAETMTYAELGAAVDGLARRLRGAGVGRGTLVAVRAERSLTTLVGLLAVARAGGAYLPLDPDHPAERLRLVLEDSGAALLLAGPGRPDRLAGSGVAVITLDAPGPRSGEGDRGQGGHGEGDSGLERSGEGAPGVGEPQEDGSVPERSGEGAGGPGEGGLAWPAPGDLAYVIYTSGSTGRPKGVEISHRALTNLLLAMRDRLGSRPGDGWLAHTSLSFDISALELYLPLVTGGRVVIAPDAAARDGRELVRLAAEGVSHVQATPSGWRMLLDAGFDLRRVTALAGGEALPAPLAREILSRTGRLINVYGPTETTIWSMSAEIAEPVTTVPIGVPLANTRVHVLDERLGLLPLGVPGELCIAGDGVADGYRNRPELTAERFAADPFGPGRLYRTGDRVVRRADGQIEFIGRLDDQIKLRGHRIEPGEIESRLLEHPGIPRAAVVAREDDKGERRIVAYLECGQVPGDVREHCAQTLPSYMIPADFVALPRLPLTPNGKLDRSALPAPGPGESGTGPHGTAAGVAGPHTYTGVAAELHEIWCDVLGVEAVGPQEDLFELGGHSLTITQIASRVRLRLGADLPLHIYYDEPTISAVAAAVERLNGKN